MNMGNFNPNSTQPINIMDRNLYDVTFHSHTILTLLTSNSSVVDSWIFNIHLLHRHPNLIVGLDVEWRPHSHRDMHNPVATLQLCVGHRCLVFQILHALSIPHSLISFLVDPNHTFVGVGIEDDVAKLLEDYSLHVANFVDLRSLAVEKLGDPEMKKAGLKKLGLQVLGLDMEKPKRITRSKWDNLWLTVEQVQYASIDAFVSFEIGRRLISTNGV
ncbi:hypothetical protein VNO77_20494 [Canavalia gladiata]|uniref:3'-5' exonuclease domain-containing protein n=1 Tax=Canavalia gladiata TaxID=3824 RepID=A0AAN9LPK7_CANGL